MERHKRRELKRVHGENEEKRKRKEEKKDGKDIRQGDEGQELRKAKGIPLTKRHKIMEGNKRKGKRAKEYGIIKRAWSRYRRGGKEETQK